MHVYSYVRVHVHPRAQVQSYDAMDKRIGIGVGWEWSDGCV